MIDEYDKDFIGRVPIEALLELAREAIDYTPNIFQNKWHMRERYDLIRETLNNNWLEIAGKRSLGEALHQPQDAHSGVGAIVGKLSDLTDDEAGESPQKMV